MDKNCRAAGECSHPPPWIRLVNELEASRGYKSIQIALNEVVIIGATDADEDFILHSREDVLLLIREIRRLSELVR